MPKIIERKQYLNKLLRFKDRPFIKIITGIRRCGKSTVMKMFADHLIDSGVPSENILHIRFDLPEYLDIDDTNKLMKEVNSRIKPAEGIYLFFDEIQEVAGWEKAVNAMFEAGADVYITGSNSRILSSEFSTYLSGRFVEIKMYPLSFREYLEFGEGRKDDLKRSLDEYKKYGGFPAVALSDGDIRKDNGIILSGIYDSVFLNDVIEKNEIRDIATIKHIFRFLMKNIGNQTSVRSISDYIISKGGKTHPSTADTYIQHLESAYLIYRAKKYNIKARDYLRTMDKFYAADLGIRNNTAGLTDEDRSGVLENLVFMELLARGKDIASGSVDGKEIDFIVFEGNSRHYYQVTDSLYAEETRKRELRSLLSAGDNYPKTVITNEPYPSEDIQGIKVLSMIDFLLEEYE